MTKNGKYGYLIKSDMLILKDIDPNAQVYVKYDKIQLI